MPTIYVAKSKGLEDWGADVGLTKHVYKVGVADNGAEDAVQALIDGAAGGHTDWKLVKKLAVENLDEATAFQRIAAKERMADPSYYPGVKGLKGVFKVKPANVENSLFVEQTMAGQQLKPVKVNAVAIADYLIKVAAK
jgi:hypothetical protein